ncbi:MAG: TonB-dependent receptor, partial [Prevotella sp.]
MQKKLKLAVLAMCYSSVVLAQNAGTQQGGEKTSEQEEQAFTFTEAQLGEDDDINQNVTIIGSSNNVYASEAGYLFSPVRFRYRAFNQKFNDVYINGAPMNDMETGQFRFSQIGGINTMTRNVDFVLPFESSGFAMTGMGGSNNYDFRASHMASGNRLTLSGANRSYTLRAMYSFGTGVSNNGWSVAGSIGYRWADRGYVKGTFYNSLSYFFGVEKKLNDQHSISITTWGNPTERASQGASTDEAYWLANNNFYNPYWGYQNGKIRNSRVIHDYSPSVLLTWDYKINEAMKLTTSLTGKYSMYKSTKLNYNNSDNPQPDYWKNMPSSYYDVWGNDNLPYANSAQALNDWTTAYDYWTACEANRQIDWDRLYFANTQANNQGQDAMYFIQAKHNDNLNLTLSSSLATQLTKNSTWNLGFMLASNKGMHYQTMEDMLGATSYHNINTYAVGTYTLSAPQVQYDLNNPNAEVREGDRFGYDYNLLVNKATAWTSYTLNYNRIRLEVAGKVGGQQMQRDGKMRNGLAANNSYGKSGSAEFLDGGGKLGIGWNIGGGHAVKVGAGFEWRAPLASTAFVSPEVNNDFVENLKNEKIFSSELNYVFTSPLLQVNLSGYYSRINDATEWQSFYFDDINSFSYVSMTGIDKEYYGVELGMKIKLASFLDLKLVGSMSEAKYVNNADVRYMNSTEGISYQDVVMSDGMRESGTPLTVGSIGLSYHSNGWYIDLTGNYYDRIYLSWAPNRRYVSTLKRQYPGWGEQMVDENGNVVTNTEVPDQLEGKGGFMLDGSIGKSIYLKKGSLSINLSVTNILNNIKIVTGGYEQSRSDYTTNKQTGELSNQRIY